MSEPDDPSAKSGGGADRIEAMLADFRTAPVAPPVTTTPPPPAAPVPPRRPRDEAVRPLWQAEGGRAAAPRSPWWQTRPVWALAGLLVGIAGSQTWQALRLQDQRNQALASISTQEPVALPRISPQEPVTPPVAVVAQASEPALIAAVVPPAAPDAAPASALAEPTALAAPAVPVAPVVLPTVKPPPAVTQASRPKSASAAASASKQPAKADSPAARCKQLKGNEFQRCLQTQCRKDRYFAHRQCIALYERNARP